MSAPWVIGIDVGGTKIAAGRVQFPKGDRCGTHVVPTEPRRGGKAVLETVLQLARTLANEVTAAGAEVEAIGLGLCELVDDDGRVVSANCIDWLQLPVRERLSTIAPATLEADVRAGALAEARFGAGRPFDNFLYVTVGTGISCCLMLEGRPYLGARGLTGTMGSSPLRIPCEHCGRANERSLEEIASGPALAVRFQAAGGTATTAQQVLKAAINGDEAAQGVVASASQALASQVGLLVNVLDPEAVVIGGGLGLSEGPYWKTLVAATRLQVWSPANRDLPILRAITGADAGWLGAAARAWLEAGNPGPLSKERQGNLESRKPRKP